MAAYSNVVDGIIVMLLLFPMGSSANGTDFATSNSVLSLLSLWANITGDSSESGLTACLRLPLSVNDPVLTPFVYPLNVNKWFKARNTNPNPNITITQHSFIYSQRQHTVHYQYSWPRNLTLSKMNCSVCRSEAMFPPGPVRLFYNIACSKIPWGINPEGVKWSRDDNSLAWNPTAITPTWYLALPPGPNKTRARDESGPVPSVLQQPRSLVSWNESLAINILDAQDWCSYFYPILRAARLSQWCHGYDTPANMVDLPRKVASVNWKDQLDHIKQIAADTNNVAGIGKGWLADIFGWMRWDTSSWLMHLLTPLITLCLPLIVIAIVVCMGCCILLFVKKRFVKLSAYVYTRLPPESCDDDEFLDENYL
ncbi:activin receptor type-1C isoform X1 [Alligator sinensis]|uniref:Activin receptor type-1C isoform X1 n=1 Tax=Alligator sinensis TaxID=38654 RepID=A0A3Q0G7T8_ALLSI|nr:activin receptor type-1C isoform X1 [Alligator sinensis]